MPKKPVTILLTLLLLLGILLTNEQPTNAMTIPSAALPQELPDNVDPELLDVLSREGSADYVIEMAEQADLSVAYTMTDWDERGWYVYEMLKETAARTQLPVIAYLEDEGLSYQSFFAGNEVMVFAGALRSIETLAALPGVAWIRAPRTATIEPIQQERTIITDAEIHSLAWGIGYANADDFWSSFGFQGDGIIVANIDTGVQWDHPALDQSFKCGTDPTDPACWADPSNICGTAGACDNHGHGTHTMGTMVGDDDPGLAAQVGMAPNAQWIACKGCEYDGITKCSNFALNSCADWILAPDGNPSNRPHIVNNSWGGGGGDAWYLAKVQAWRAAGTFPAFSAGNSGSSCNTIGSPGDYQESFASGSHNSNGTIANSSSRGPSDYGHDPYTKPNIAAPGVSVYSSVPTDGWGYSSGTSMASPHSAGAVALLWSCNPALIGDMTTTFELLQDNAGTAPAGNCSAPPDGEGNYTYGYGYLDVYQAGLATCSTAATGTLEGYVYDDGMNPLEGAAVTALTSTTTNASGFYTMTVPAGTYTVTASKNGYSTDEVTGVEILEGMTTVQDFQLSYIGDWQDGPTACFDWTRFDTEYFPGTGLIYALGGRSGDTTDGTIYSYNPETGECLDTGTDMPTPISNYSVNLVNDGSDDLLCTFGGRDSGANSTPDVQCYDPIANSASVVAALPGAYSGYTPGANVVYNNQVYVFGGFRTTSVPYELARTDRYNPVAGTFTQLGDLTLSRSYIYAAIVDGKIYAFGGTKFDGSSSLVPQTKAEVMADPEGSATWNDGVVDDLPSAYAEGRAFGFDSSSGFSDVAGKVIFTGGGQWPGYTADVWTYEPSSDTYDTGFPDMQYARRNHADAYVPLTSSDPNDGLPGMWVFGGYAGTDDPPYAAVEFYPLAAGEGGLVADPLSFDVTMSIGDPPHEETLTLINNDGSSQDFSILEINQGYTPLSLTIEPDPLKYIEEGTVVLSASDFGPTEFSAEPDSAFPDAEVNLIIDDGSRDDDIGIGGTWEFIWLNRFTPNSLDYPFTLNEIQVYFSSNVSVGDDIVLVVYENTSGNTDPAIGDNFLYKLPATVQTLDAWNIYTLPAGIPLMGPGDVLIGVIAMEIPGSDYFPAALDETTTQGRSWAGWWTTSPPPSTPSLPPDDFWVLIDDPGFPGNWMLRGVGTTGEDVLWLSEDPVSGMIASSGSQDVTVTFDATGLVPGDYQAILSILNSPNSPIQIPVTLHVNSELELIKLFLPIIMK